MHDRAEYTLGDQDIADLFNASPTGKGLRVRGIVAMVGGLLALGVGLREGADWVLLIAGPFFIVVGAAMLALPRLPSGRAFRNFRPDERSVQLELDAEGYRFAWPKGELHGPWSEIHRASEAKRGFVIYPTEDLGQFIPKRALTPEAIERIRSLVGEHGRAASPWRWVRPMVLVALLVAMVAATFFWPSSP